MNVMLYIIPIVHINLYKKKKINEKKNETTTTNKLITCYECNNKNCEYVSFFSNNTHIIHNDIVCGKFNKAIEVPIQAIQYFGWNNFNIIQLYNKLNESNENIVNILTDKIKELDKTREIDDDDDDNNNDVSSNKSKEPIYSSYYLPSIRQPRVIKRVKRITDEDETLTANEKELTKAIITSLKDKKMNINAHQVPEAIIFRPTIEEFKDPIEYVKSIEHIGIKYGICKIIPPKEWTNNYHCNINIDQATFQFKTRLQQVNRLQEGLGFNDGNTYTPSDYKSKGKMFKYAYFIERMKELKKS